MTTPTQTETAPPASSNAPLVSTAWLAMQLSDPTLRLYDCTVHLRPAVPGPYVIESGRGDYNAAHIPGAAFLDLMALSDPDSALRFTLPSAAQLAAALSAAGIGNEHTVVLYSSTTPMWATRVWWMLRSAGHRKALVLDGGLTKWRSEGRVITNELTAYPPAHFIPATRTDDWATQQDVLNAIDNDSVCTVNALSRALHTGESDVSYGRKGHIAGSVNVPYSSLLEADGTYRRPETLRAAFAAVGAMDRSRVICYCGGGISATMDALALVIAGHRNVAIYDGSMSEWVRDASLPMSLGD